MTILPVPLRVTLLPRRFCQALLAVGWLASPAALRADVTLPHVFGDNMVLQRQKPVPVWGTAAPGEQVTVEFAGQKKDAAADTAGHWRITLDPLLASEVAADMTVSGRNTIKFANVLVGEVWLCSGQSKHGEADGRTAGPADDLQLRGGNARGQLPRNPAPRGPALADGRAGGGRECVLDALQPGELGEHPFSAAAYFFGRKLLQELKVPIGLIDSSFGGSPIEPWIPKEGFALAPSLADMAAAAQVPWVPKTPQLAMMFNGMIAPLVPYALRGVLWYQGESNVTTESEVNRYADKMDALIRSWRSRWQDEFPFYYVQIAPFTYFANGRPGPKIADSGEREPMLWEQQTDILQVPRTGMIVTTDITDNVHDHIRATKRASANGWRSGRWRRITDVRTWFTPGRCSKKWRCPGTARCSASTTRTAV